jgi:hypothetical protein
MGPCTERGRLGGPLAGARWADLRAKVLLPLHARDAARAVVQLERLAARALCRRGSSFESNDELRSGGG